MTSVPAVTVVPAVAGGWTHLRSGKVRDLYTNQVGELLLVASDRISAFDYVLPTPIPNKGKVLTQLSLFWFDLLADVVRNHLLESAVPIEFDGRAVVVKALTMFPIECVARGYLTGSAWVEYQEGMSVCGISLPPGLIYGSKLPQPIFTPARKAEMGDHDENIDFDRVVEMIGQAQATALRDLTLRLYSVAHDYAATRGIILADTKFEFGTDLDGVITLGDEVLTPDSSRFWAADTWRPGAAQPSFDKQFVRDWLSASGWDRQSSPPELPPEIVVKTQERYEAAYKTLTGKDI